MVRKTTQRPRPHNFRGAGTEVGCGINDAHRESHRNRFLLEQLKPITLLQRFAPVLMKVKGCNKERGQVHERPLPTRSTDRNGSIAPFRLPVAKGSFPSMEAVSQSAPVNDN